MDLAATRLFRDGVDLKLRPQAFHALKALARNSGRYIDYERMIQEAWDGTWVSRHTVDVTIQEVRKVLNEYSAWIVRGKLGYCLEVPPSDELIRKGWHFWNRRSREGFEKALGCFEQAALQHSTDFRAYEGLSLCYLTLASFGMRAPKEMHRGFLEAHGRAVALAGMTPELRSSRAHGLHIFEHKKEEAEAELLEARRENPNLAIVHERLTLLYTGQARFEDALQALEQARGVDPLWPMLPATEAFVYVCRREFERGVVCGKRAVELHPYLHSSRAFYAQALEYSGRMQEALEQYHLAAVMFPDFHWLPALEATCLARSGRPAEAEQLLRALEQTRASEYVDAYAVAMLQAALGRPDEAFRELERAIEENSSVLFILDVDPKLDALRADPRFAPLRDKLFGV
jgi:tetratricopeptide (TPR) repeat protein